MSLYTYPWLVADIGGTHARFGVIFDASMSSLHVRALRCADYPSPEVAARHYLAAIADDLPLPTPLRPVHAAFALASVIQGDVVRMTNSAWTVSRTALIDALGADTVLLLNDFEALALALPHLTADDVLSLGAPGIAALDRNKPMAVLGPGTGLGVAACIPHGAGAWIALPTEGGHVTLAAADDFEANVLAAARAEYGHVSAERLLSGIGLPTLNRAVHLVLGDSPRMLTPEEITQAAAQGDAGCARTLDTFCAMLGSFAGNVALTLGARGGVFLAGGIAQRLASILAQSQFRQRFEAKGRFADYLAPIATCLITSPHAALTGAAQAIGNLRPQP